MRGDDRARRPDEAGVRPAWIGLRAIGRLTGDGDVVNAHARANGRAIRPVAEAQLDGLSWRRRSGRRSPVTQTGVPNASQTFGDPEVPVMPLPKF